MLLARHMPVVMAVLFLGRFSGWPPSSKRYPCAQKENGGLKPAVFFYGTIEPVVSGWHALSQGLQFVDS